MNTYRIAVIAGDGIGKEVIPAGMQVLAMAADQGGFRLEFTELPWGCDFYLKSGRRKTGSCARSRRSSRTSGCGHLTSAARRQPLT